MKLNAKTVVITGAAQGIGRETAILLAEKGAKIFAVDIDESGLRSLEEHFSKYGFPIKTFTGTVTDSLFLTKVRDAVVQEYQTLDIWINNAGVAKIKGFLSTKPEDFQKVLDINLHSVICGTRLALEFMENHGAGLIVNVGSIAGYLPAPMMTSYNASKFAVVGFTKSLQAELRLCASPVSIMLVSPGFVDTKIVGKGHAQGFPEWLSFMLSNAKDVARDIVKGISSGKQEVSPTLNGKLMKKMYSFFPETTVKSSRILLTKNLKDFLSNKIGGR